MGDMIPEFSLKDQNGELFDVKSVLGIKRLVIFFYPKDGSLSCTKEACYFRDINDLFLENDTVVMGISGQSVESHREFALNNRLTYKILSDPDNKVRKLFGVPSKFFNLIPGRVTYVTDRSGKVIYIFDSQMEVQRHADEALKIVLLLKKTS